MRHTPLALATVAIIALAILIPRGASAQDRTVNGITVSAPWLRATPGGVTVAVAYARITAAPGTGDRLVSVSSPLSPRVELHTHVMEGDIMRMRRIDGLAIPAGQSVALEPMGAHVMLLDITRPLQAQEAVPLTFSFEKAGPIAVQASVEAIGATAPDPEPVKRR